ncbi:MAG: fibronectin type III domain-containing protein [bacterium]
MSKILFILLLLTTLTLATFLSLAFQGISPQLLLGSIFGIIYPEMIEEKGVTVSVTVLEIPKIIFFQDIASPYIFDILVHSLTSHSVIIDWKTNEPGTSQIDYGLTQAYELGTVQDEPPSLNTVHSLTLKGLSSGTTYHFRIRSRDSAGNERISQDLTFTTLTLPDRVPPANIASFKAEGRDRAIYLSWINPPDPDFLGAVIKRSRDLYPIFPEQGVLVYQGKDSSFLDENLINSQKYYYTAFSYDQAGNYSSGALASAVPQTPEVPIVPEEIIPPLVTPLPITLPAIGLIDVEDVLDVKDVSFSVAQGKIELALAEEGIKVLPDFPINLSIAKEKFPFPVKTIWLSLENQLYLLKENFDKSAYEVTFISPSEPGRYSLDLGVVYQIGELKVSF